MKKAELSLLQKQFRDAMSCMASATTVVTTNGPAGQGGITATAVCSITDTPPTVLVCVNQSGKMNSVFRKNKALCINILSAQQQDIAEHFAGMTGIEMSERFTLHPWVEGLHQLPVLEGALGNLEGIITQTQEIGTHSLFFVELGEIQSHTEKQALVYFNRNFHPL